MRILGIDPGNVRTAWVVFDCKSYNVLAKGLELNHFVTAMLSDGIADDELTYDIVVIEYPQPRGQPMYTQLVDTICQIGRYANACGENWVPIDRKDIKMELCGSTKAKDSNIRASLMSLFEPYAPKDTPHKVKIPVIGTKDFPGPLYGISKDLWAALAVAVTYSKLDDKLKSSLL